VRSAAKELVADAAVTVMVEQAAGGIMAASTSVTQQVQVLEFHNLKLPKLKETLHLQRTRAGKTLVFCRTKKRCDWLARKLEQCSSWVRALHSDKTQLEREDTLASFRGAEASTSKVVVLVATNVASRGLDIRDVSFVVIYDFGSASDYVHQVGRTGRAMEAGHAITFYVPGDGDAAALADILHEAKQQVPQELEQLAQRERARA